MTTVARQLDNADLHLPIPIHKISAQFLSAATNSVAWMQVSKQGEQMFGEKEEEKWSLIHLTSFTVVHISSASSCQTFLDL